MKVSRSKYIDLESIPLGDLFKEDPGATGFYIPAAGGDMSMREAIAKISAQAKAYAVRANKKCVVKSIITLEHDDDTELPATGKILKVVVTPAGEFSPAGELYMKSIVKNK